MIQRYGDPEHVIFHESRVGTAIRLGIKEQFTDTGAELIRIADIPENPAMVGFLGLGSRFSGVITLWATVRFAFSTSMRPRSIINFA